MKQKLTGVLVWVLYKLLSLTWRVTVIEPDEMKSRFKNKEVMILAHWHGDELALFQLIGHYRIATLISTSKDGEIMNMASRLMGVMTTRGSSTRGGAGGLRALIKIIKQHRRNSSFAVDGPKGPIYKAKPGVFELSRLVDAPIFPGGVAVDRAWKFPKSWNQTYMPKPFSRIVIRWETPLSAVSKDEDPRSSKLAEQLENALHYARAQAQINLAGKTSE